MSTPSLSTPEATLIVDDHTLVRVGLRRLAEDHKSTGEIMEAVSAEEALSLVRKIPFQLILMDLSLPGLSGIECSLRILKLKPEARIIILTGMPDTGHANRLLKAGVLGYLTKGCSTEEVHRAMTYALSGRQYISEDIAQTLALDGAKDSEDSPFTRLTQRELEVALQLLEGNRNRQISDLMHISEKTVSTHRRSAFDKLGIDTTAELARMAMNHGLWAAT